MKSPLKNKAFRAHLIVFLIASAALVIIDILQSDLTDPMLFGLHWAPIPILFWGAVVLFHGLSSIWGAAVDDIDDVRAGTWV